MGAKEEAGVKNSKLSDPTKVYVRASASRLYYLSKVFSSRIRWLNHLSRYPREIRFSPDSSSRARRLIFQERGLIML